MKSPSFDQSWQGRIDQDDGKDGQRIHQIIQPFPKSAVPGGITLAGFASDLGVHYNQGRTGAAAGPLAARRALANFAWHFDSALYDTGDITIDREVEGEPLAMAQSFYADTVSSLLEHRQFVIGLGGGHEIAWGSYQGCRRFLDSHGYQSTNIGVLNFDAHFDLRKPPANATWAGSSGTPFYQVEQDCKKRAVPFNYACLGISQSANTRALFNYARQHRVSYLMDHECVDDAANLLIRDFVESLDCLYVTICLDALPAHIAPGVSAPASLGISLQFVIQALELIDQACRQFDVSWLMADIAELNPSLDHDNRTARVAARLAYEMIRIKQRKLS